MLQARTFEGQVHLVGRGRSHGVGSFTPALDRLYAIPNALIMRADALVLHNLGGGTDCVARMGLYYSGAADGMPTTLIEDVGEQQLRNDNLGELIFALDGPYQLDGTEWAVVVFGGAASSDVRNCNTTFTAVQSQEIFGNSALEGSFSPRNAVYNDSSYGALPGTFPTPSPLYTAIALGIRAG